jgi:hypothetical protein
MGVMNEASLWERAIEQIDETQQVEYKSQAHFDTIKQKLCRAALAMANAEGGVIIVGINESTKTRQGIGEYESSYTDMAAKGVLVQCGTPNLNLRIEVKVKDGLRYPVIFVERFLEYPHLCNRDLEPGKQGIQKGTIYYRTLKPASKGLEDDHVWLTMMRAAGAAAMQALADDMGRVGCQLGNVMFGNGGTTSASDQQRFEGEMEQ